MKSANNFTLKFYGLLFGIAFVLNWIWEVSQMYAFSMGELSFLQKLLFCSLASVIDGIATIAIFWILQKLVADVNWKFYLSAAGLGAIFAIVFEQVAFTFNLWSYGEVMPVLPTLGTGLLPLTQLPLLVPAAIRLTFKLKGA